MKNIYILGLFLALFVLNTSCDDDGGTSAINTTNGALPDFKLTAGSPSFIDLTGLDNLNLQFTVGVGVGEPTSFDLKAFYQTVDGDLYGPIILDAGVTTFPKEYSITGTDIVAAFSELSSADDIQVGDVLKFYTSYTFKDGSKLEVLNSKGEPNYYAPDFNAYPNFTVKLEFVVSCPSDLAGTYTVLSSGSSTDSGTPPGTNPIVDYPYTVVVTDNGGGNYTISDGFAGLYILWYESSGSWVEPFGTDVTLTGMVNPDGTLSISWINGYDDTADAVYTPQ